MNNQVIREDNLNRILIECFDISEDEASDTILAQTLMFGYDTTEETINEIIDQLELDKEFDFTKDFSNDVNFTVNDKVKETIVDNLEDAYRNSDDATCCYIGDKYDFVQWYKELYLTDEQKEFYEEIEDALDIEKYADILLDGFTWYDIATVDGFYYNNILY